MPCHFWSNWLQQLSFFPVPRFCPSSNRQARQFLCGGHSGSVLRWLHSCQFFTLRTTRNGFFFPTGSEYETLRQLLLHTSCHHEGIGKKKQKPKTQAKGRNTTNWKEENGISYIAYSPMPDPIWSLSLGYSRMWADTFVLFCKKLAWAYAYTRVLTDTEGFRIEQEKEFKSLFKTGFLKNLSDFSLFNKVYSCFYFFSHLFTSFLPTSHIHIYFQWWANNSFFFCVFIFSSTSWSFLIFMKKQNKTK